MQEEQTRLERSQVRYFRFTCRVGAVSSTGLSIATFLRPLGDLP